jgi:DNA polymerase-3 subunit gamma/tau
MSPLKSQYIPFARKYRPTDFSQLMGQEVLTKTLSHCIAHDRLFQAYLLTGIRGIGKTSSARIIAKTINCTEPKFAEDIALPCGKCSNCSSFAAHNHPDIIELDAASKTSIDDIREIIESCEYRPLLGRYKFFIIDEIHMLSKSAFNALLKIIEEPPAHVIFIFATTEAQKIPLTVISRCQRYDLKRFSFEEILALLNKITVAENLKTEDAALRIIANFSEGSAREAVSILDQLTSYVLKTQNGNIIRPQDVTEMLGLIGTNVILNITQLIIANNPRAALELLQQIYFKSGNLLNFVQEISVFMAELCKYKVINNYNNPVYNDYLSEITDLIIGTSLSKLTILWQIFNNGELELKHAHNELICAEMIIIRAIYAYNLPNIENILDFDQELSPSIEKPTSAFIPETQAARNFDNIHEFLKYCRQNLAIEICYILMHEVEVSNFSNGNASIKGNISTKNLHEIKNLLKTWSGTEWTISVTKSDNIKSLKEELMEKVKSSENYNLIKNYFPDADISDIILKK